MKKFTFNIFRVLSACLVILIMISAGKTYSQGRKIELTPFGGYMLGGSIKFYEGKFKVEDSGCYGGMLAIEASSGNFIELSYTGMTTQGNWEPYNEYISEHPGQTVDMAVNHFQIGSVNELHLDNEAIRPYGTLTLGTTWFNIKEDEGNDKWLFSVAAGVGLKYFFTDRIGIRLQARLLLPVVYNGGGFYIGTGGSGMYVSSTAPIVEGDFTGGLIIALGDY
jgi:hypothetical protein